MRADMTDACTREGAERMEAEAALPKEIAERIEAFRVAAREDARLAARALPSNGREAEARAALESAILADRERLAAESEARRLVLVLKATELREARDCGVSWEEGPGCGRCVSCLESRVRGGVAGFEAAKRNAETMQRERDEQRLRAERAEEALRGVAWPRACDCHDDSCPWCRAAAILSPLPAPRPAPEEKP